MLIRNVSSADHEALADRLIDIEAARSGGLAPAETRARLSKALPLALSSEGTELLVSLDRDGRIQGYGSFHLAPLLFLTGPEPYLTALLIRPSARGIGTELLDEARTRAIAKGCSRFSLLNDRDIESYQRGLYEKHGWEERSNMANSIVCLPTS